MTEELDTADFICAKSGENIYEDNSVVLTTFNRNCSTIEKESVTSNLDISEDEMALNKNNNLDIKEENVTLIVDKETSQDNESNFQECRTFDFKYDKLNQINTSVDVKNGNESEECDTEEEDDSNCSLQELRQRNIERNKALLAELFKDMPKPPNNSKLLDYSNSNEKHKKKRVIRKVKSPQPQPRRRSLRVRGETAKYNEYELDDLLDDNDKIHRRKTWNALVDPFSNGFNFSNAHKFPKIKVRRTTVPELPVSEVTQEHIDNISKRALDKVYSPVGTSCHQCRQKTKDTKTFCRSGMCAGVRGQFCGPCLDGRYGESVAEALRDPAWSCPPCRGICNCSICFSRQGRAPTGILRPYALEKGYKSVKHYLEAMQNKNKNGNDKTFKKIILKNIVELIDDLPQDLNDLFYGFD